MIRKWLYKALRHFQPKAIVLMYHRVHQPTYDPWQLAVSPANFEQQLRIIRQKWLPVSLPKLVHDIANQSIAERSIALTFDDGYFDNFTEAKPLLEHFNIPATFFITTQNCEHNIPFWWDELQNILLDTQQLPHAFELTIANETLSVNLADEAILTSVLQNQHRSWLTGENPPTRRSRLYLDVWKRLKPLINSEQQQVIDQLRSVIVQPQRATNERICMTVDQISQLATNPLFSIGAHTGTHPDLAVHGAEKQRNEINNSKLYLEQILKKPVKLFAYPYGSFTDKTVAILEDERFKTAVTTNQGLITKHTSLLQVNRYQVVNSNGEAFDKQLAQWFSN